MMKALRRTANPFVALLLLLLVSMLQAQGTPPATPLIQVSRDGRRTIPTTILNNQELIALDDVASLFQVSVREDTLAGGITLTYKGRTIVVSAGQSIASVNGRLVALPAPLTRGGRGWLIPVEFLPRALGLIYDARIELRRPARLLLLGDVRVPRVTARVDSAGPPTRTTIEITPPAQVTSAIEGGRVLVRVEADALDLALPPMGDGLVEQFRSEPPTTVAAVMSGRAGTPRVTTSTADNITRVVIEVSPLTQTETPAPAPAPPPAPLPPLPIAAPTFALQAIVLDPGHGGDDIGAHGPGGTQEKQLTLAVARRLKALIETRLGIRVILTRDDDRALGLDERAATANNNKADLFLSLHFNASLSSAMRGSEVFYQGLDREGEQARRSAQADAVSLPVLGGGARPIEVIRWDLAQARHIDSSAALAEMLAADLRKHVPMGPHPIQQAPVRVLSAADMPAALIELGYLTNRDQEREAQSEGYQGSVAEALYETVLRFRSYLEGRASP